MKNKILILGSSSWLGYLLLEELSLNYPRVEFASTIYKNKFNFDFNVKLYSASKLEDYEAILKDFEPTVIVNFLRGEDDQGMLLHHSLIEYSKNANSYYLYASSALALDGYKDIELTEDVLANGKSEYGLFKANCEQALYDSSINWCVLRFSSVQGWISHKHTRNEIFLLKLSKGQNIIVDRGVYQNRMLANLMIKGIADIIHYKHEGIIHFGTIDSSDELTFLQKQAEIFGYSPKLINSSSVERNVNLVCVPNRIYKLLGDSYKVSEADTLHSLRGISEFKKYINI
jgi:dTDP-4-dehydrorhamnose reductase